MKNTSIIGAGFGGLAAAYDLVRAGHNVTIYEAADHVGGLSSGFKQPHWDWSVEKYYHHWFEADQHMWRLIEELGWKQRVLFPRPYTVMYYKDRFYPFDSIIEAIKFPGLGWGINKVRFGLVLLYLRLTKNWRALEKVTVDAWMRQWAGNSVFELMWEPLMIGKFGERYAKRVSMAWMWARIHARSTRLGTYQGGFQAFADQFAERLKELGVNILLETPVSRITPIEDRGLTVETHTGAVNYDQVLVTTSPTLLARLAPALPDDYLNGLLSLKSMGAVVMVLALKQQLSEQGYYWFNLPKAAGFPFLALVEHTNYVFPENFGGDHIVYIGDYLEPDHEYFQMSKEQLLERFLPTLTRFNPKFNPDWVRNAWLFRTDYAQPVSLVDHSINIPPIETPIPGLYFASMSQVYPWDRGTNYAVEVARKAAGLIVNFTER
ncbi:MAG: NAD(P)/FAD-dependent oxidoreductase [Chloroflexota bacterium]|nr:NAD(P)/FAD-dependent oxidoreductase [Chloroflexota bacterium]